MINLWRKIHEDARIGILIFGGILGGLLAAPPLLMFLFWWYGLFWRQS